MLTIAPRLDVMNRLGRAMADPTRSRILMTLLDGPSYPAVLSRELDLTRSNVSNHLTCLRDCGIVVAEPKGRQTRYEIADPHLAAALTALDEAAIAAHALVGYDDVVERASFRAAAGESNDDHDESFGWKTQRLLQGFAAFETRDSATRPATRCKTRNYSCREKKPSEGVASSVQL